MSNRSLNRSELYWAGGLFEGEGCISHYRAGKTKKFYPVLQLAMTDEDSVRRFHNAILRIGRVNIRVRKNPKHRNVWAWRVVGFYAVQAVLCLLYQGLGTRRKQRAKEIMAEYLTNPIKRPLHKSEWYITEGA